MSTKQKKQKNSTNRTGRVAEKMALIQRVIAVKKRLPESGVTSLFVQMFPSYKPADRRSRVSAVLQLRSVDVAIVEKLEIIADKIKL